MTDSIGNHARFQTLCNTTAKQAQLLASTDQRLFATPLTQARLLQAINDELECETLDAFASRLNRLEHMLLQQFLPALLMVQGKQSNTLKQNLTTAQTLGLIGSAKQWLAHIDQRDARCHVLNQDTAIVCQALNAAHDFVPVLVTTTDRFIEYFNKYGQQASSDYLP